MKVRLSLLFLVFSASHLLADAPSIDDKLKNIVKSSSIKGLAVSIVDLDSVLYMNSFGYADEEADIPYSNETIQPIASISKTLLGVSIMKAQELGYLNLDDQINQYLSFNIDHPEYVNDPITIRHLATHTSGLKDTKHYDKVYVFKERIPELYKNFFGLKRFYIKKGIESYNSNVMQSLEVYLKSLYDKSGTLFERKNFTKNKPGETYNYSNNGAAIASMIVEKATGMTYQQFVERHILQPLGMSRSGWDIDQYKSIEKSSLYFMGYKIPEYELITKADGGFLTTIDEFTTYFQTMMKGYAGDDNILQHESFVEMMNNYSDKVPNAGLFWEIYDQNIGHAGGDPGIRSFAFFDKNLMKANIVFINTSNTDDLDQVIDQIFKAMDEHYQVHKS